MSSQKRENFRLEYPPSFRPSFTYNGVGHDVVDLSEKGLKFALTKKMRPKVGEKLVGTIKFKDNKTVEITGEVLRILADKDHCVLMLSKGIPLPKMMEEQRTLLQMFKK